MSDSKIALNSGDSITTFFRSQHITLYADCTFLKKNVENIMHHFKKNVPVSMVIKCVINFPGYVKTTIYYLKILLSFIAVYKGPSNCRNGLNNTKLANKTLNWKSGIQFYFSQLCEYRVIKIWKYPELQNSDNLWNSEFGTLRNLFLSPAFNRKGGY